MTQTEAAPTQEPDEVTGHGADTTVDDHHDPLHDIDDMKTVVAIIGSLVVIVAMVWGMSHLYNVMVQVERQVKIGDIKPIEYLKIRGEAELELAGKHPDRGPKTIDEAIKQYLAK